MLSGLVAYLAILWLVATGVGLAVIDFKARLLPRVLIYPLYTVGITALCASSLLSMDFPSVFRAGAGGLGLGAFYSLVFVLVPGGLGWGDVTLAGILAFYLAWIGWGALILGALLAFALGAGFGLLLVVLGKAESGHKIAFGPWMLLGALFGGIWGNSAWLSYLEYLSRFIS
jgi:leader peptidase (prepilin peptidase)/N-methyltransferase